MAGLEDLPTELLYIILIFSGSDALPVTSKRLQCLLGLAPNSVRARYLLERWHDAYNYRLYRDVAWPGSGKPEKRRKLNGDRHRDSSSSRSSSLGPEGFPLSMVVAPQLYWPSKFVPVLPCRELVPSVTGKKEETAPSRCSHYILNYCLRFPVCNHIVLEMIEERILTEEQYGNIVAAASLPLSSLSSGEKMQRRSSDSSDDDAQRGATGRQGRKCFFPVTELPQRLFGDFKKASTTLPRGSASMLPQLTPRGEHEGDGMDPTESCNNVKKDDSDGSYLRAQLETFGPLARLPATEDLLLLLRILLLHSDDMDSLVDSYDGYGLAKAVFTQQQFVVGLLLAFGADPKRKKGLSYTVACKANWVQGARMLIEREDSQTARAWRHAKRNLAAWLVGGMTRRRAVEGWLERREKDTVRAAEVRHALIDEGKSSHSNKNDDGENSEDARRERREEKRRRKERAVRRKEGSTSGGYASDRVPVLRSRLLRLSIQSRAQDVAEWLRREKGVSPDLKTLQMLDDMVRTGQTW